MKIKLASDVVKEQEARQKERQRKQGADQEEVRNAAEMEVIRSMEASKLCYRVAQVYWLPMNITRALEEDGITEDKIKVFEDKPTDTIVIGYILNNIIYLVFRGTEPTSLKNWLTDMDIWPAGSPKRHRGFQRAWETVQDEIKEWIKSHYEDGWQLVLAGHSLGGALATLAAIDLSDIWPIREVRTYGSPRVGLWGFRKCYSTKYADPIKKQKFLVQVTTRYVHNADLFPHLPPPLFYCHVKEEEPIGSYSWETFITSSWGFIPPSNLVPLITSGSTITASSHKTASNHQKLMRITWWGVMASYAYLRTVWVLSKLPMEFWWAIATLTRSIPIAVKNHSSVEHYSDPTLYRWQINQPPN